MPLVECGFRIQQVHLAGAAVRKDEDNRLGFCSGVWLSGSQRVLTCARISGKQTVQCQRTESAAGRFQ